MALVWRVLVLAGLLCLVVLPDDTLVVLVRRVPAVRREAVVVRRLVRAALPAAAIESASTCASESARNLA